MRVLLAFDKFKDSLAAPAACDIAARALTARHSDWEIDRCPLADGGEGFCEILTRAAGGEFETRTVTGPRGAPVSASIGFVSLARIPSAARSRLALDGPGASTADASARVAVIEMAAASGLALLSLGERDPWHTTTLGTGELVRAAARPGVVAIVLGVGGSATNDLGLGALAALGVEYLAAGGGRVAPPIPASWDRVARLAGGVIPGLPAIRIACDVTNPLLGPQGAAAIYGPQKGLRAEDLARLDHAAARLALMLCTHCRRSDSLMDAPGAGAAGGISFGLMVGAGARLLPGFELVTDWLDLERRLAAADLVITGEGRFDESSLFGKGPGAVAARALAQGKRVHVFAGQIAGTAPAGLALHAITPPGTPMDEALRQAPALLAAAVEGALG